MKKILSGTLVITLTIILGLQIDDKLEASVTELLNKSQNHKISSAYFYLMGIKASTDDFPSEVGKKIYKSILQGENEYLENNKKFSYQDYPDELKLPLPCGDLFCNSLESDCLESLFHYEINLDELLEENTLLLKRYEKFNTLNDYSTLTRPTAAEPLPPYSYIVKANRLIILSSIKEAQTGNPEKAIAILTENFTDLRKQLALQDNLVGKLVFLSQLSENIDVTFLIHQKSGQKIPTKIPPITQREKDFEILMGRELSLAHNTFRNLDGNPEFWKTGGNMPSWVVRIAFKPNMTTNVIFPNYRKIIENSYLSQTEFTNGIAKEGKIESRNSLIRNFTGARFNKATKTAFYNRYIARFHDIDSKFLLFNSLTNNTNLESIADSIVNPYYKSGHYAYLSKDDSRICFEGPLPDEYNFRCLKIKI